MRLRFKLPLIQVLLATLLLFVGHLELQNKMGHWLYKDFGPPGRRLCYALNAPALLIRFGWSETLGTRIYRELNTVAAVHNLDDAVFLTAVVLVWFLVGLEVERRRIQQGQMVVISPLRIAISLVLVCIGVFFGLISWAPWVEPHWGYSLVWEVIPETVLYLLWGLTLSFIYSRDLLRYLVFKLKGARTRAS